VGSQEPVPLCWFLLAGNLYSQDRATEAWQVLLDAENRFSGNWQVEEMQVYWMTAQGRYREADSILDAAGPGGDPRLQGARLRARAGIAAVQGRLREAREHLAQALRVLETAGLAEPYCWAGLTDALLLMELRRDTAQALQVADGIVSHPLLAGLEPMDRPFLPLAQFYALAGDRERAGSLVQEFLSLVPEYARGPFDSSLFHVRGVLASQQGRFREAREAFLAAATRTTRIRTLYYQAFLNDLAQEPNSALLAYQAFLEVPDIRRLDLDQFFLGPVLVRIAEVQIARGNPDAATLTLDHLSSLWQDADHELTALVADLRRQTLRYLH
jgi:tetratricopeptide (TPR) repeat protein